jgi:hypothetical protein
MVALAPSRRDATGGSALDGVLSRRKDRRHRWTGHPHRSGWHGAEDLRDGEQPPARGKRGQPPTPGQLSQGGHEVRPIWCLDQLPREVFKGDVILGTEPAQQVRPRPVGQVRGDLGK